MSLPLINLHTITLSESCLLGLDYKFIHKHQCLIFAQNDCTIHIALKSENAPLALIRNHLSSLYPHKKLEFFLAQDDSFEAQLEHIKDFQEFSELQHNLLILLHNTNQHSDEKAAISLLDCILRLCIKHKASDIHFESQESIHRIKIRTDGMLREIFRVKEAIFESLSACLKLECKLDINQKRQSQDGRFSRVFDNQAYDFRLSALPSFGGESLVIRILHKNAQPITLQELGFQPHQLKLITHFAEYPSGMIILSGPTGSGKSTTLYAILESIKSPSKKIITLEDPIEYLIQGTTQVLINDKHDFGFSHALKALLRHDPDILMIGEIRDEQSLNIALRASLTGHLVLSTIHANDSLSIVERLLDMGAKDYLLISTLRLLISQRLVRKLCEYCKTPIPQEEMLYKLESCGISLSAQQRLHARFYTPCGCQHCHMQGYKERLLIAECLDNSPLLQRHIKSPQHKSTITQELRNTGFQNMFEKGLELLCSGLSSFEEIYRVCRL